MAARLVTVALVIALGLASSVALAQQQPPRPPAPKPTVQASPVTPAEPAPEIKLDETTTLKAAALEARMSAIVANFALLQRQAQDLQQEMAKILEERKKLIEDAATKSNVNVADANEWAFDNKGSRYVHARRAAPAVR